MERLQRTFAEFIALGMLMGWGCAVGPKYQASSGQRFASQKTVAQVSREGSRQIEESQSTPAVQPAAARASTLTETTGAPATSTETSIKAPSVEEAIDSDMMAMDAAADAQATQGNTSTEATSEDREDVEVPINLPSALAAIGGDHPVVGYARWRVQEAYAQLDRARVMWLPSIQTGFNYRRRDGNYQDVQGAIVDVNLNSMNYGLGAGAVAAGSPTQPGVVARFHLADAIFLPKTAKNIVAARDHAATATFNQQLLLGALAYVDLVEAVQDVEIYRESSLRTQELVKLTEDYARAGQGLRSDADRAATEFALLQTREIAVREKQQITSTRLARALSLPMTSKLVPQDTVVVPLDLCPDASEEGFLISTALGMRPELKESQSLVSAAREAYQREKTAPFVPSVLLGFSTTSFGGGLGSNADQFAGRYDIDTMMVWEMRNFGAGEGAARRERNAQVQQAMFTKLRLMDQIAQEVAEANVQVAMRREQWTIAQSAIESARDSYRRNLERIKEGEGLPIEVLQAIQALENAQRTYLQSVSNYNRAQLQLQWALGWPIELSDLGS